MKSDLFRAVRERVSARDAAERFGLTIDRHGRALCPFHEDHHPSMSFKHGRFRCFACGAHGDAIDLAAQLLGLTPLDALARLNEDFGLGLALHREPTAAERKAAARRREVDKAHREFESWREDFLMQLCAAIRTANEAGRKGPAELTDGEVVALQRREAFEHWADALSHGNAEEQAHVYKERRAIGKWIKLASSGSSSAAS